MIIVGVIIEEDKIDLLRELGVKDSKLILPQKRFRLFKKIIQIVKGYKIITIQPSEIDSALEKDSGMNLNWLEALKTVEILNSLKPDSAFIDCPSPNTNAYKSYIRERLNNKNMELIVEPKADVHYLPTSAASIIAKVERDKEVKKIEKMTGMSVGSGYVSNPVCQKFLKENWDKYPEIFRKSWISWKNHANAKKQKQISDF